MEQAWLTPAELGAILRRSAKQINVDCAAGKIPAVRVGSSWRIPSTYLDELRTMALANVRQVRMPGSTRNALALAKSVARGA